MDTKYDKSAKQCVNCPGRTDHDTAHCPVMHYGTLDPQQRLDVARGVCNCNQGRLPCTCKPACTTCEDTGTFPFDSPCPDCQPQASAAQSAPAGEREAELVSALEHIAKTCNRSRTSTRRLRWIEQRAKWAIEGKPYDRDAFDLPKDGGSTAHKLSLEVARLKAELAEVQRTQSAGVPEGWRLVPMEPTDEMLREIHLLESFTHQALAARYAAMLAAAPAQPAAQEIARTVEVEIEGIGCCQLQLSGDKVFMPAVTVRDILHMAAAQDQGEVQRLREALEKFEPYLGEKVHYASDAADDCRYWRLELFIRTPARNPEPFDVAAEKWIRAALAASTGQEVKP